MNISESELDLFSCVFKLPVYLHKRAFLLISWSILSKSWLRLILKTQRLKSLSPILVLNIFPWPTKKPEVHCEISGTRKSSPRQKGFVTLKQSMILFKWRGAGGRGEIYINKCLMSQTLLSPRVCSEQLCPEDASIPAEGSPGRQSRVKKMART